MGAIAPTAKNLWGRCTQVAPTGFFYVIFETVKCTFNLFATRPVAATGFQTTAAYYTLRGDGLRGSQTYAVVGAYESIIVHMNYLLKSANILYDISLWSSKS